MRVVSKVIGMMMMAVVVGIFMVMLVIITMLIMLMTKFNHGISSSLSKPLINTYRAKNK